MKYNHLFSLLATMLLLGVSNSAANAETKCPALGPRLTPEEYCARYSQMARQQMRLHGVPASITLAQGMIESGYGSSYLAVKANNHFGIKAYMRNWTGPVVRCDDDKKDEPFCSFETVEDGFEYHSYFLLNNSRYARLFKLNVRDYEGWARGLKECGYATDPNYANSLIDIIERYQLNVYDVESDRVVYDSRHTLFKTKYKKGLKYVVCVEGDELSNIAKEFGVRETKLRRINDLPKYHQLKAGDIIYLQSKRSKADSEFKTHTVRAGESMWSISQRYGVTVKSLLRRNHLVTAAVQEGQVLRLR